MIASQVERIKLKEIGAETTEILRRGSYHLGRRRVMLKDLIENSLKLTLFYNPEDLISPPQISGTFNTRVEVRNEEVAPRFMS